MKIKLLLVCFFGTLVSMQAQNAVTANLSEKQGSVSGKIIDLKTSESLPYVNVVIKEANQLITAGVTSEKGIFYIKNLDLKNYNVEIQFMVTKLF